MYVYLDSLKFPANLNSDKKVQPFSYRFARYFETKLFASLGYFIPDLCKNVVLQQDILANLCIF